MHFHPVIFPCKVDKNHPVVAVILGFCTAKITHLSYVALYYLEGMCYALGFLDEGNMIYLFRGLAYKIYGNLLLEKYVFVNRDCSFVCQQPQTE